MGKIIDLTGMVVGLLTVVTLAGKKGTELYWMCTCECGKSVEIRGQCLRLGRTRSCGCQRYAGFREFNESKANHEKRKAIRNGRHRFSAPPCPVCGCCSRYVSTSRCVDCARVLMREKRKNQDTEARKSKETEIRRRWKEANPGRDTELARARRETPEGRQKFREYMRYYSSIRRCAKLKATPPWVDKTELEAVYRACPEGYHVDHIVPLKHPLVCGLHVPANLQYLPAAENVRKNNTWVADCAL